MSVHYHVGQHQVSSVYQLTQWFASDGKHSILSAQGLKEKREINRELGFYMLCVEVQHLITGLSGRLS